MTHLVLQEEKGQGKRDSFLRGKEIREIKEKEKRVARRKVKQKRKSE